MNVLFMAVLAVFAYLLGSIPFGLLLTRLAGLGDIRKIGSGNIGATNVLRTGNKPLAVLTLMLDGAKGAAAVLIVERFYPGFAPVAGAAVMLGHLFPVWLKFKGGKGVATAIGVVTALAWPIGLVVMAVWLITAGLFRYSSLAALVSIGLLPVDVVLARRPELLWLAFVVLFMVFGKHHANIRRLLQGRESKIGSKS